MSSENLEIHEGLTMGPEDANQENVVQEEPKTSYGVYNHARSFEQKGFIDDIISKAFSKLA